jgi:hypothetical protein
MKMPSEPTSNGSRHSGTRGLKQETITKKNDKGRIVQQDKLA